MSDLFRSPCIPQARALAREGRSPSGIMRAILPALAAEHRPAPRIPMEACLLRAFGIPLRILRDTELWVGFSAGGAMTDREIDELLGPWLAPR